MLLLCTTYYLPLVKQASVTTIAVMTLLITNKAVAKPESSTMSNPSLYFCMPLQEGFVVHILLWWSERIFREGASFFTSMNPCVV